MNDVIHTVTDGLMGFGNINGTGVHIKIGASPVQNDEPIIITSARKLQYMTKYLGLSPLRDAVMDSVENGAARIICIPVNPSAQGEVRALDPTVSDNSGTITINGKPNNRFDIIVRITGRGVLNTASFKYSINGGHTYSEELTVPLSGEFELPDTGTKIAFALDGAQEYEINDTYRWQTTAPRLTNEDVMKGVNLIKAIKQEAELVHIVGACGADTWAMVSAMQTELQVQYHKPLMFVLEAFEKGADESMDDYTAALKAARKLVKNYQIQVVAARMLYAGMDGLGRDTNAAGVVCGLYGRTAVNRSIGETAAASLSEDKVLKLLPEADDDYIDSMDEMGYLTLRQYDGLKGYYINNARVLGPEDTDYGYAEDVRVLNKIIRETRKEALMQLQSDIDMEKPVADLKVKAQFIKAPLDRMVTDREISSVEINIPDDAAETVLMEGRLRLEIRYVQRGIIRNIEIDVGKRNPYAS